MTRAAVELFCGAGLATRGMIRAGFREVYAYDIKPQPRQVAYSFRQEDVTHPAAWAPLIGLARECGFVWASPPCQFATELRHAPGTRKDHLNLIPWAREFIEEAGVPGVIENVEGAREHLRDPIMLEGGMFGLGTFLLLPDQAAPVWHRLERRRYFECIGFKPRQPKLNEYATGPVIGVYGAHARVRGGASRASTSWLFTKSQNAAASDALGVAGEGLTLAEMSEGIPPAYASYIMRAFKRRSARD